MDISQLHIAAERFKQGLLAVATDGDYNNNDYMADLKLLMSDQKVAKLIPPIIQVNRTAADFRRAMQAKFRHYADRRNFIDEQTAPIFEYIFSVETGTDSFTLNILPDELSSDYKRGGFGCIHRYHHKLLDMDFAVKLFDPIFVSDEENIEGEKRFFREAKILFALNHENIVRVYDIGRYNGQPYIRMEYVDGDNMQEYIDKNGTVSFKRSLKPIIALLQGLKYAHSLGVVHRDLKPTNFMVTADGKFKIIDFGVSAFLEVEGHTKLTKTGEKVVSGVYTAPELSENPKLRDVRSDIYSVGAIWYYLLVGHSPAGGDIKNVLLKSGNATELEASIIMKCLSNSIEDRYHDCNELLTLLMPKPTGATLPHHIFQNKITEITRQGIFDYLIERHNDELEGYVYRESPSFQQPERVFYYYGRKGVLQFIDDIFGLENIPSQYEKGFRYELTRHTINNDDYGYDWAFSDARLNLMKCNDEILLKFLSHMFHPLVRIEKTDWQAVLEDINKLLAEDGYEIFESEKISGKSIYSYKYLI